MRQDYDSGKYTVIFDRETGELRADRNGEAWRDLSGDKLVYCMLAGHAASQAEVARLRGALDEYVALKDEVIGLRLALQRERTSKKQLEGEDFARRYNQTTYGL